MTDHYPVKCLTQKELLQDYYDPEGRRWDWDKVEEFYRRHPDLQAKEVGESIRKRQS